MSTCVRVLSALLLTAVLSSCSAALEDLMPDERPGVAHPTAPSNRLTAPSVPGSAPATIFIPLRADRPRVEISDQEFRAVVRQVVPYIRTRKSLGALEYKPGIVPVFSGVPIGVALDAPPLVKQYAAWCRSRGLETDCVGVLREARYLADDDKPRIALDLALGSMDQSFKEELLRFADPNVIRVMLLGTMAFVLASAMVPTGVTQAVLVGLAAYLGFETVWNLINGYLQMAAEARKATTFTQLRTASDPFAEILGREGAKVLIMLVLGAISEGGLMARLGILPKAGRASELLAADTGGMLDLAGIGSVRGLQISAGGATITLDAAAQGARASAMAMAARGRVASAKKKKVPCRDEDHHIATNKNDESTARGGPWTPAYKEIFDQAGLSMENKANIVSVYGHVGPHPEEYHSRVYEELREATLGCNSTEDCRAKLVAALTRLAKEVATPGSNLNDLITKDCQ